MMRCILNNRKIHRFIRQKKKNYFIRDYKLCDYKKVIIKKLSRFTNSIPITRSRGSSFDCVHAPINPRFFPVQGIRQFGPRYPSFLCPLSPYNSIILVFPFPSSSPPPFSPLIHDPIGKSFGKGLEKEISLAARDRRQKRTRIVSRRRDFRISGDPQFPEIGERIFETGWPSSSSSRFPLIRFWPRHPRPNLAEIILPRLH